VGCRKYFDQVVVVDDLSGDRIAEITEALGASVVRRQKNMGSMKYEHFKWMETDL
jgi:hypothetical protein